MALSLGLATNVPFVAHAQPTDTTSTTIACSPTLIAPGAVSVCTATVTDTAGTGYVPTGNVTFTSSSTAVGTVNNICFLSAAALCSVNFTGVGAGHATVTGTYQGDAVAMPSLAATSNTILVAVYPSTCPAASTGQPCISVNPVSQTIGSTGGSTLLYLAAWNLPTFSGWDILLKSNAAVLTPNTAPASIQLLETFSNTQSVQSACANGAGTGCGGADGGGIAHSAVVSLGG